MITTIKDFYQNINDLEIDGFNAPIKIFSDGEEFFIKDVLLKNDEVNGTYCNIELISNRSSLKDDLSDLIKFIDQRLCEDDFKEVDIDVKNKAVEGINKIKKILQR